MGPGAVADRFPLGAALTLDELERYDNAPVLHRLRAHEPVTWFAEHGAWLVTSRALFDELQMDPERFVVDVEDNPQRVVPGRQMLVVDGEEHARHRGPFAGPFKHSAVHRQFAEVVGRRVDGLLAPGMERLERAPDDSMLSAAIHTGVWRTREELEANLRLILFGGVETVESMILNTTWALLHHPEQVRRLAADPDLWPGAVQEGLRFIPPVGYTDRWATADTALGGVRIARGDYVIGVIHAANRDPAVVPDPDRFDITRDPRRQNLSFGKGIHMCLGVNLARLQGTVALRQLFTRLPGLRLDPEHPTEPGGFNFRRPPHLRVLWDH
jgi:cytochrome P450